MTSGEFSDVLRQHGSTSYLMACRLTGGDEQLARDLVQDAFLKIWRKSELKQPQSFRGWMYRILRNQYLDHLRRKNREASVSYDIPNLFEEGTWIDACPAPGPLPTDQVEQDELQRVVQGALERLPHDFRIPVMLCDIEGYSYEEIARRVDCPVGTVRSRIHRGRRELRTLLKRIAPAVVAAATALGAWFLCRAQKHNSFKVHVEMAAKPVPPLAHLKGERRDHEKS